MSIVTYHLDRTGGKGFSTTDLRKAPEYEQFVAGYPAEDVDKYLKAIVIERMLEHGFTTVTVSRPHDLALCSRYIVDTETDPTLADSLRSALHPFLHARKTKDWQQSKKALFAVPVGLAVPQHSECGIPVPLQRRGYFLSSYVPDPGQRLLLVPPDPVHSLETQYSMEFVHSGSARAAVLYSSDRLHTHTTVGMPMDYVDACREHTRFVYAVHDGTVAHFLQRDYLTKTKNNKFRNYLAAEIRAILLRLATHGYYLGSLDLSHFVLCDWNRDKRRVLLLDTSAVHATDDPDPFQCSLRHVSGTTDDATNFLVDRICTYHHMDNQKKQKKPTEEKTGPRVPEFLPLLEDEDYEEEDYEEIAALFLGLSDPFEPLWQVRPTERPLVAPTFQESDCAFTSAPPCMVSYHNMVQDILATYSEPPNPFTDWEVMDDEPFE